MTMAIYATVFLAVLLLFNAIASMLFERWRLWQSKQLRSMTASLDDSFVFLEKRKLAVLTTAPLVLAGIGYVLFGHILGAGVGAVLGLAVPGFITKMAREQRIRQFQGQLVDTLVIFSSSLKGGLSFVQALEIICEEMPAPVSQEFGLVLKENKLGVSLEDSLEALRKRIPIEEVHLIVTSILVAKETGGELTRVFSRLVGTIRDKIKLKEKMATLTLQGKLQGVIMSFLPIVFTAFVYHQTPDHFNVMLETQMGKTLLVVAVTLQIVGMFLIRVFGKMKV